MKDVLLGENTSSVFGGAEKRKVIISSEISKLIERNNGTESARIMLGLLFPYVGETVDNLYVREHYNQNDFFVKQRIASPNSFNRYFTMALEDTAMSKDEVELFLNSADNKEMNEIAYRYIRQNKAEVFIENIQRFLIDKKSELPLERAQLLLKWIISNWSVLEEQDELVFLGISLSMRLIGCVDELLRKMDKTERMSALETLFRDKNTQVTTISDLMWHYRGPFHNNGGLHSNTMLEENEIERLERVFAQRADEVLKTREWTKYYRGFFFWGLYEELCSNEADRKRKSIVTDNKSLLKVISYCITHGVSNELIWRLNAEKLEGFVDVTEAYKSMCEYVNTDEFRRTSIKEQEDVLAFLISQEVELGDDRFENEILEREVKARMKVVVG